ncbi:protein heat-stress-associated 32 [Tanacetum coccineum]
MGHIDVLIRRVERCLEAGADMISIDAEDVCRYADSVTANIIAKVIGRSGLEKTSERHINRIILELELLLQ